MYQLSRTTREEEKPKHPVTANEIPPRSADIHDGETTAPDTAMEQKIQAKIAADQAQNHSSTHNGNYSHRNGSSKEPHGLVITTSTTTVDDVKDTQQAVRQPNTDLDDVQRKREIAKLSAADSGTVRSSISKKEEESLGEGSGKQRESSSLLDSNREPGAVAVAGPRGYASESLSEEESSSDENDELDPEAADQLHPLPTLSTSGTPLHIASTPSKKGIITAAFSARLVSEESERKKYTSHEPLVVAEVDPGYWTYQRKLYAGVVGMILLLLAASLGAAYGSRNAREEREESNTATVVPTVSSNQPVQRRGPPILGTNNNSTTTAFLSGNGTVLAMVQKDDDRVDVSVYQFFEKDWVPLGSSLSEVLGSGGSSIALADDQPVLAVGHSNQVQVYEYQTAAADWVVRGAMVVQQPEQIRQVALSSDGIVLAVLSSRAIASLYRYENNTDWVLYHRLNGTDETSSAEASMALSGNGLRLAITMPTAAGTTMIRTWGCNEVECTAAQNDIRGSAHEESSSIAFNYAGNVLAVGAPGDCSSTASSSNCVSNNVRVYQYGLQGFWNQIGQRLFGAPGFGTVVRLSKDGTRLAVLSYDLTTAEETGPFAQLYDFVDNIWQKADAVIDGELLDMSSDGNVFATRDEDGSTSVFVYSNSV